MITRRSLMFATAALAMPALAPSVARAEEPFPVDMKEPGKLANKWKRKQMAFETAEPPGTLVVDSRKCFMYLVLQGGEAIRYGVSLGKSTHAWEGEVVIAKMAKWPKWTPAPYHIQVKPELAKWVPDGMPGGPDNPMGARAMYLFKGDVDTINRIHGGMKVADIGSKKTAGCIGMLNADIIDLYDRIEVGTRVVMTKKKGLFG